MKTTTIDASEVEKFRMHANQWWELNGPLKTLHDINPARLQFIKNGLALTGARVLDVGCGGGILAEALAKEGALVTGLDAESAAIEAAKAHAKQGGLTIDYVCSPIETYDAPLFDAITCMEMLEHVAEPALVIEHCSRLLKPGGYLFLSTINRTVKAYASVVIAAEYLLGLLPKQTHDFAKFIKPSELVAMARSAGLDMLVMSGLSYHPLTRAASLQACIDVNYLMLFQSSSFP